MTNSVSLFHNIILSRDYSNGGEYEITGTVAKIGNAGPYHVRLYQRRTMRLIRGTTSDDDGAYTFSNLKYRYKGYCIIAEDKGDTPFNSVIVDRVTPVKSGEESWYLEIIEGETLSGTAITSGGDPADLVSLFDWDTKERVANVEPDSDGSWTVTVPDGEYGINYFADGCAPICHGPYTVDSTSDDEEEDDDTDDDDTDDTTDDSTDSDSTDTTDDSTDTSDSDTSSSDDTDTSSDTDEDTTDEDSSS